MNPVDEIDAARLRELLDAGADVTVLDVRDRDAFSEWRIPGSRHLETERTDGTLVADGCPEIPGDGPAVVVCQRGRSSRSVARDLNRRCSVDARSLEGGMDAWTFAWNAASVPDPDGRVGIVQLRRTGKGCLSYLAGAGDEAVVIDPSLAPEVYLEEADGRGWTIRAVLDTHVHADHVSRARVLADAADARLVLPDQDRTRFDHERLADGERIDVGPTRMTALHTPGHTSESLSYVLDGRFLFSGDTLFLDSVGRPDLESGGGRDDLRRHARLLHASLTRLADLDDDVLVLPGHTGEPVPFDGSPLTAPLGRVRKDVSLLDLDEPEFVRTILERIPPTPPNHDRIVELNEAGTFPETELTALESGANRCAAG